MSAKTPSETVVLIHGIWMTGLDMSLLQHRLRRCGFKTVRFSYPTVRCSLKDNAARLQRFVQTLDAEIVHFVGHSLGGLLLRQFFHNYPDQRPGRIVTMGTPHAGSAIARRMGRNPFGKILLGESYKNGLRGDVPEWDGSRDMAVISGNLSIGMGRLMGRLPKPNDGTVSVAETLLPGMKTSVVLPVTHMGMLFSPQVANIACQFLRTGLIKHGKTLSLIGE